MSRDMRIQRRADGDPPGSERHFRRVKGHRCMAEESQNAVPGIEERWERGIPRAVEEATLGQAGKGWLGESP